MTRGDRERWDSRHAAGEHGEHGERGADPFVARALAWLANLEPGTALDLAAGTGRHALALARGGWRTTAWDVSPVALAALAERAAAEGLAIETRAVDLVGAPPPQADFDLVVVVDFLDRPLFERLRDLVPLGGHLIVSTFTVDRPGERPQLEYCLARGELARGLPGFAPLHAEEAAGRAGLIAARRQLGADG